MVLLNVPSFPRNAGCSFCIRLEDTDREPPGELVWSFPTSMAFLGRWQHWQGYIVLVSRSHCREPIHLPQGELDSYTREMFMVARSIEKAFQPLKLNYELLGNQVEHPHWHIFPRQTNEMEKDQTQPVWVLISRAENHLEKKAALSRLEAGTLQRTEICHRLKIALREMGAEWQAENR